MEKVGDSEMRNEGFRLSPEQKRVWEAEAGSDMPYRAQTQARIKGHLDTGRLKRVINEVVDQYEVLRTRIKEVPEHSVPLQVVAETDSASVAQYDLRGLDAVSKALREDECWNQMLALPIDIDNGPVLHVRILSITSEEHSVILLLPAYLSDAKGNFNLLQRIIERYVMSVNQKEDNEEVVQYADIAEWRNSLIEEDGGESGIAFWREQTFPAAPVEALPFETRSDEPLSPGLCERFIPADDWLAVKNLATEAGVTSEAVLLACFKVLVWRIVGEDDVVIGTGSDGRQLTELEDLLGLFHRVLPLYVKLDSRSSFLEVAHNVQKTLTDFGYWEDYFEWRGRENSAQGDRSLSFHFEFDGAQNSILIGDLSLEIEKSFVCTESFKVRLVCTNLGDSLGCVLFYDKHRFEESDCCRLLTWYGELLRSVVEDPGQAIGELNLASDVEKCNLLPEFCDRSESVRAEFVHRAFNRVAAALPDKNAVVMGDQALTYKELSRRANQLAHYLKRYGVEPESLVGVCMDRSLDMIVALLGILKAGGAYVPLDPQYPKDRLQFMVQNAQVSILVTQRHLRDALMITADLHVVCLDDEAKDLLKEQSDDPVDALLPENLAYVLFTSGSTGQPKGVQVTHQNLAGSTRARLAYYRTPVDRFLLLPSYAFDSSVVGIYWTLTTGGTLILVNEGEQIDPYRLRWLIERHEITHMLALPSVYGLVLGVGGPEELSSLDAVIVAGEACPGELVEQHHEKVPGIQLFNEYGPTEGTVWSTVHECRAEEDTRIVPIGKSVQNVQAVLLDGRQQLVPVGVVGELYIGGIGVARGYLGRPDLTAERFIPNPFAGRAGDRLYRTGDLARSSADGTLEFVGRSDNQVKIRGYRIELEEVESALCLHGAVARAAVVAHVEDRGATNFPPNKHLVAYVACHKGQSISNNELYEFLKGKLPEFMLPAVVVFLETLPIMPNGKIDYHALPAPETSKRVTERPFAPPRMATEEVLAGIWEEVLGVDQVGIHDNFFELGGHSLLIVRLVARIRHTLGVEVAVRTVLEFPTVAMLAQQLMEDSLIGVDVEKAATLLINLMDMSEEDAEKLLEERTESSLFEPAQELSSGTQ